MYIYKKYIYNTLFHLLYHYICREKLKRISKENVDPSDVQCNDENASTNSDNE